MPVKLSTTVKSITSIPNPTNATLLAEFYEYMKSNSTSESYQNCNLKILIYFARFLGAKTEFYENKCAMCGKEAIISDEHEHKHEKVQQERNTSDIIADQIDGTSYTFDTAECAMMFKRFSSVYGSNFADD